MYFNTPILHCQNELMKKEKYLTHSKCIEQMGLGEMVCWSY